MLGARHDIASALGPRGTAWPVISWPRFAAAFLLGAAAVALLTGIPTVLIPNDWFTRMTPVQGYAYPVWALTAVLSGLLAALHWGIRSAACPRSQAGAIGGAGALASWLGIGCPVCNKLIVAALGAAGAMTYFAPLQPWLAAGSLGLLVAALALRLRALVGRRVAAAAGVLP